MKKWALGFAGLLIAGILYYFIAGSSHIITEMKKQVNTELHTLSTQGFSIQDRNISKNKEHFTLAINDIQKIAHSLKTQGTEISPDTLNALQGIILGMDIHYLPDSYSAIAVDMYPLALPQNLLQSLSNEAQQDLKQFFAQKRLLAHININKLGTAFKGYIKDINQTQHSTDPTLQFISQAFSFRGTLEHAQLKTMTQEIKQLSFSTGNYTAQLHNLQGIYTHTGKTSSDYTLHYTLKNISLALQEKALSFDANISLNAMVLDYHSVLQKELLSADINYHINTINLQNQEDTYHLQDIVMQEKIKDFDMQSYTQLQQTYLQDPDNKAKIQQLLQALISKGIHIQTPHISVKKIIENQEDIGGFHITSTIEGDSSYTINTLYRNPMSILSAFDAHINIQVSDKILTKIKQNPKAMLAMMIIQPEDINGSKVFDIKTNKGKVFINYTPLF